MEKVIKWGLIGCGDVAERKGGPALYSVEQSQLWAVASRQLSRAEDFAERHGAERAYDSVEALLADAFVDAVYVATPVFLHAPQTILAANAGKHVLCEKPMAMHPRECEQMIEACRSNNVSLQIAYYRPTYPNIEKMKHLLESGFIGKPILAEVRNHSTFRPIPGKSWKTEQADSGGGVLMDIGSHRLDLLRYLFGDFQAISGQAAARIAGISVDSVCSFQASLPSAVQATGSICWGMPVRADSLVIHGEKGILAAPDLNNGTLILETDKGQETFQLPNLPYTHCGLVKNFTDHLLNGTPLICSGTEGRKTNQYMADIYQQSRG